MSRTVCTVVWLCLVIASAAPGESPGQSQRGPRGPDNAPKIGDEAPTFKLKSLNGKSETDLASFRDEQPVVLFFGSYT